MKKIILLFSFISIFSSFKEKEKFLFSSDDFKLSIMAGLKNNDSEYVSKYFSSSLNFVIFGKERIVNKYQAYLILNDFLNDNKIKSINHGKNLRIPQSLDYTIYQAKTENGNLRISMKFIDIKHAKKISEIRIE